MDNLWKTTSHQCLKNCDEFTGLLTRLSQNLNNLNKYEIQTVKNYVPASSVKHLGRGNNYLELRKMDHSYEYHFRMFYVDYFCTFNLAPYF